MIIGLGHQKRVGKDTVADFLVEHHDMEKVSFAAPLKELAAICVEPNRSKMKLAEWAGKYGLSLDSGVFQILLQEKFPFNWRAVDSTGKQRHFLQWLGTDLFREHAGEDFWVKAFDRQHGGKDNIVATDVRFPEEFRYLQEERGACMVKVVRPGLYPNYHASETALADYVWPTILCNNGTLEELNNTVESLMRLLYDEELRNEAARLEGYSEEALNVINKGDSL